MSTKKRSKKNDEKSATSLINVRLDEFNEINEIEYYEVKEVSEGELDPDEIIEQVVDKTCEAEDYQTDGEEELIVNEDGSMTIKMPAKKKATKSVIDHECAKCSKKYSSLPALKRHINLCKNLPKNQVTTKHDSDYLSINVYDEKYKKICFCCNENKETAHYGHVKCNFCPKSFKSHTNLERHLFTLHSAKKDWPCNSCNATCATADIMEAHLESHETGKPFSCQNCGKDFTRKYHLDRHLQFTNCDKTKSKKESPCHVCGKLFARTDNLREHLRAHIGESTRKRDYQCPHCDKSFYGSSLLNIHIRTHTGEKPFLCDLCDKSFPSNGALRKHRRMHTGEKPYICKTCGKCFSAKETLNRHNKIHTGERPHVCEFCNKSFIQSTQLRSHLFNHTGENGYACAHCDMKFNRKNRLELHIKSIHLKKDGFKCESCEKMFATKSQLKSHRATHQNSKIHTCDHCKKRFSSKQSLRAHVKSHHDDAQCKICNKQFNRMDSLIRHMTKMHRDELYDVITTAEKKKIDDNVDFAVVDEDSLATTYKIVCKEKSNVIEKNEFKKPQNIVFEVYEVNELKTDANNEEDVDEEVLGPDEPITFMDDEKLMSRISELLKIVVDEDVLTRFGYPTTSIENVLSAVLEECGQTPIDYNTCPDPSTKMRENVKLLFTTIVDDESIQNMLNNNTIDEVINHFIDLAKS